MYQDKWLSAIPIVGATFVRESVENNEIHFRNKSDALEMML